MSLLSTVLASRVSPLNRLLEADTIAAGRLRQPAASDSNTGGNRRRDPRFSLRQSVQVALAGSFSVRWEAILQDFSAIGLGLLSGQAVPAGETLIVEWRHGFMVGLVRHCRRTGSHFLIGIELDSLPANRLIVSELRSTANLACGQF